MASSPRFAPIITGFQPFGSHRVNPSRDAAEAMAEALQAPFHCLPVTFAAASQFARDHLRADPTSPFLFLHLGLAADREHLSFEFRARNRRDATPDNLEKTRPLNLPSSQDLLPGEREARCTYLNLTALLNSYEEHRSPDLPVGQISRDCGAYVCNAIFYHSLRASEVTRAQGRQSSALFIHIPAMEVDQARHLGTCLARVITTLL